MATRPKKVENRTEKGPVKTKRVLPHTLVGPDEPKILHFQRQIDIGDIFLCRVVKIKTPGSFYVQSLLHPLEKVMEDIQKEYQKLDKMEGQNPTRPSSSVLKAAGRGMLVAARLNESQPFHRAMILGKGPKKDEYHVRFVDYGDKEIVHKSNIRYLLRQFLEALDIQGIKCNTAVSPQPLERRWTSKDKRAFADIVRQKPMAVQFLDKTEKHGETIWSVVLHRMNKSLVQLPHVEREIYRLTGRPKYVVNRLREVTELRKKLPFELEFKGEERKCKKKKVGRS